MLNYPFITPAVTLSFSCLLPHPLWKVEHVTVRRIALVIIALGGICCAFARGVARTAGVEVALGGVLRGCEECRAGSLRF